MANSNHDRRTDTTAISRVQYLYNKPDGTSDLNESEQLSRENLIRYLQGKIGANTLKVSIDSYTNLVPGTTTINFLRFFATDANKEIYYGGSEKQIVIDFPTPAPNTSYDLYAFCRFVNLDSNSTVYKDGIRTNSLQPSIVETTVTNNIEDPILDDELSTRLSIELTFVAVIKDSTAPELSDWTIRHKCSTISLDSSQLPSISNEDNIGVGSSGVKEVPDIGEVVPSASTEGVVYYDTSTNTYYVTIVNYAYGFDVLTFTEGLDADKPSTGYYHATDTNKWYKDGEEITVISSSTLPDADESTVGNYYYDTTNLTLNLGNKTISSYEWSKLITEDKLPTISNGTIDSSGVVTKGSKISNFKGIIVAPENVDPTSIPLGYSLETYESV